MEVRMIRELPTRAYWMITTAVLLLAGCASPITSTSKPKLLLRNLPLEERRAHAEKRLPYQRLLLRRASYDFLHFLNDNQSHWRFRLSSPFEAAVVDERLVAASVLYKVPYTDLRALGSIVGESNDEDVQITFSCFALIGLQVESFGWSAGVFRWWKAVIDGEEILNFGFDRREHDDLHRAQMESFDRLASHLDDAINVFFETHFGRADGILSETTEDNLLHNPLFR